MPLYEFSCDKCGCDFEELTSRETDVACPSCGSHATHKVMSACARRPRSSAGGDYASSASSGGCGSCSGGNCASCCH